MVVAGHLGDLTVSAGPTMMASFFYRGDGVTAHRALSIQDDPWTVYTAIPLCGLHRVAVLAQTHPLRLRWRR